ncbi:3-hydroxybutyrate dehydrogenase [Parahaliea maris]|uniref:3-hydroxybutyrate dehydrogenase n=1 Tax=Parahaliea maris TaxID=2716870 RepID=A0A5C9A345_9GAMM|nr:3-hydroxybutyrate dehydrogenase [Parahaliea maris]TXS95295.1 3-hydroxybutyrate dehydrogenase [Parahaliea maris]
MKGKVALVTGSTSGIGLAIARTLAARGCHIMLNGFFPAQAGQTPDQQGQALVAAMQEEFGVRVAYSAADLSDPEAIAGMLSGTVEQLGAVDILVNNAGIQHTAPVEEFTTTQWDRIIAINLSAAFHTIHHAIPHMQRQRWGRIVNIASVHGLVGSLHKSAYVAAKHGIVGLTKVVALENAANGITANAICPGWVSTELIKRQIEDIVEREGTSFEQAQHDLVTAKQPLPNMTSTEQIGEWVAFLCTEAAGTTTGATLAVDGGWTSQ